MMNSLNELTERSGIEKLEVGYWNVGWNTSEEVLNPETGRSERMWFGIEGQMKHVIKAMMDENCDILFCTDARRPSEGDGFTADVLNEGKGFGEYEYDEDTTFKLFWIGEQTEREAALTPGGICVIWKNNLKNADRPDLAIKLDMIPVRSKISNRNGIQEITRNRISTVEVPTNLGNVVFIVCYGIIDGQDVLTNRDAETFFQELKRIIQIIKEPSENNRKLLILLGDMNSQIGKDDIKQLADDLNWGLPRTNAYHLNTNNRGNEFLQLCRDDNLTIASVLFHSKLTPYQEKRTAETEQLDRDTPEKLEQENTGCKSDIDHFAIGWIDPSEHDVTPDNASNMRSVDLGNGNVGVCRKVRVTGQILPNSKENFHRLCVASLDFTRLPNNQEVLSDEVA